jgi:cell division transport system permease protein
VLSVFSVAVAFVCLAAALLVVVNVHELHERWSTLGRASVYLVPSADRDQVAELERALEKTPGITRVRYAASADTRKEIQSYTSDPVIDRLPDDAFPASIEVDFSQALSAQQLAAMQAQLKSLPSVESVETYGDWTDRLGRLLAGGVTAATLLALVVLGAVASVVSSTLRLALQRRRIEVEILKLVGATDAYVRRPFLLEGAAQGILGALLALMLVALLYGIVVGHYDDRLGLLLGVSPRFLPAWVALGMVAGGGLLGTLTAVFSLRKLLTI